MELHSSKNKPLAFCLSSTIVVIPRKNESLSDINLPELEASTVQNASRYTT